MEHTDAPAPMALRGAHASGRAPGARLCLARASSGHGAGAGPAVPGCELAPGQGHPGPSGDPTRTGQGMSEPEYPTIPDMSDSDQNHPKSRMSGMGRGLTNPPPTTHHTDTPNPQGATTMPTTKPTTNPKTTNTDSPVRHIKIPDTTWTAALDKAATEGPEGVSGAVVVRTLLRRYAAGEITL